jgi:DNA helicase-2/ATP-dependent DNA helicase PcrA
MKYENSTKTVDDVIYECLDLKNPKSFFLLAGAGSGKTRSLVEVLKRFRDENINYLRQNAQQVAIITYTNAACDEIKKRLDYDSSFSVSTIHSFSWDLIKNYVIDIKEWLRNTYVLELNDLITRQNNTKNTGTKQYKDRLNKIDTLQKKIQYLDQIKRFTYNPNGENTGRASLTHTQVIQIAANILYYKPLMQKILVRKYPILLIDECQDTNKEFLNALFEVQKNNLKCFTLGLFGDTMQRIYLDGKSGLEKAIPDTWVKPKKETNYRCPKRVVTLINKIRLKVDNYEQEPLSDIEEGFVRLFVINSNENNKNEIENKILHYMANLSGDDSWITSKDEVKILTLEHHMAAKRGGFSAFFDALYAQSILKDGLLKGTLPGVSFFKNIIQPLISASRAGDSFEVARIVRKYSPLITKEELQKCENPFLEIDKARKAVESLTSLWNDDSVPTLKEILRDVFQSGLFEIPDELIPIAQRLVTEEDVNAVSTEENTEVDNVIDAWEEALKCSFTEFELYSQYIGEKSRFGTHQGIKGLEFPHVMVILDDEESKGHTFSYEKLFGVIPPSDTDIRNKHEGKETSLDRTLRLFYVTCSRAEKDLAIVAYTKNPEKVVSYVLSNGWFSIEEIEVYDGKQFVSYVPIEAAPTGEIQ